MADDFHRVDVVIDGTEKRIQMSKADLRLGLQSMWLDDMDKGWTLLESRMPDLMTRAMKAYEVEKEETERKLKERLGVSGQNPLKAFIGRNWAWVATIVALVVILKPELAGHAISFLF